MYINREIDTYKWATTTTTTTFRREWASEFVAERKNAAIYVTQRCTRCIERTKLRAEWERESEWKGDKKAKMTNTHTHADCELTNHTKIVIRNGRDRKTKERKERNREWRSRKKHTHTLRVRTPERKRKRKKNTIQRPENIHTPNENKTMDSNVSKKESKNSL